MQRQILAQIVEGDMGGAEFYQRVSAVSLINAEVTALLTELMDFRDDGPSTN